VNRKLSGNGLVGSDDQGSGKNQVRVPLRRLLGKAAEWKVIAVLRAVKLMKEVGREITIDPERMEPTIRLELMTCRLRIGCSTN
jgi:hypothetical protein